MESLSMESLSMESLYACRALQAGRRRANDGPMLVVKGQRKKGSFRPPPRTSVDSLEVSF